MTSSQPAETHPVQGTEPLRQGDIFRWLDDDSGDPWRQWGIVVTADCDIVQNKHGDVLSYVPLLRVTDYARFFIVPPLLRKVLSPKRDQMVKTLRDLQVAHRPEFPQPISADLAERWVLEEGVNVVLDALGAPAGRERDEAQTVCTDVVVAVAAELDGGLDRLMEATVRLRGGTPEHSARLREQIQDKLAQLPGDAFFVGRVDGMSESAFVACLRLVRELPISAVALLTPDLDREGVRAKRLARMSAPYLYRLTQQLGDVFSSVGLPQAYEVARKHLLSSMWSAEPVTAGGRP